MCVTFSRVEPHLGLLSRRRAGRHHTVDFRRRVKKQDEDFCATQVLANKPLMTDRSRWLEEINRITSDGLVSRQRQLIRPSQVLENVILSDICIILVRTAIPSSAGSTARSMSNFECEDLRLVRPQCDVRVRSGMNTAKGGQFVMHQSRQYDSLADALSDCTLTIGFHRWVAEDPGSVLGIGALLRSTTVVQHRRTGDRVTGPLVPKQLGGRGGKIALVFGSEASGFEDAELAQCDVLCSIPCGRLNESLSLAHAATSVLARLFEHRTLG